MTALEVLRDLERLGARVIPEGDRLRIVPKDVLTPELRERVLACKPELLALFKENPSSLLAEPPSPWPPALPGLGPRSAGPFTACLLCASGTWARFGGVPLCLAHARSWTETRSTPEGARDMLFTLLDLWASTDQSQWTLAEVVMLKHQILSFWDEWPEAEGWWREWRVQHPEARLT